MATIQMPVKSKCGPPMKLLPTFTVAEVTKAIAAIRNIALWKSAGIRSFSAIRCQIQRVLGQLPATDRARPAHGVAGWTLGRPEYPHGHAGKRERAGAGAAASGGEPGGARLPVGGGLRTGARPSLRVPVRPVLTQAQCPGGR